MCIAISTIRRLPDSAGLYDGITPALEPGRQHGQHFSEVALVVLPSAHGSGVGRLNDLSVARRVTRRGGSSRSINAPAGRHNKAAADGGAALDSHRTRYNLTSTPAYKKTPNTSYVSAAVSVPVTSEAMPLGKKGGCLLNRLLAPIYTEECFFSLNV